MILSAIKNIGRHNGNRNNGGKSLDINIFNDKSEEKILLLLSEHFHDSNFVEKYHSGKIKCDSCGRDLGPNGSDKITLGGVMPTEDGLKLICQTMECFEKYI